MQHHTVPSIRRSGRAIRKHRLGLVVGSLTALAIGVGAGCGEARLGSSANPGAAPAINRVDAKDHAGYGAATEVQVAPIVRADAKDHPGYGSTVIVRADAKDHPRYGTSVISRPDAKDHVDDGSTPNSDELAAQARREAAERAIDRR